MRTLRGVSGLAWELEPSSSTSRVVLAAEDPDCVGECEGDEGVLWR